MNLNNQSSSNANQMKKLDVYVCFDFDDNQEIDVIESCLKVYLSIKFQTHKLDKFEIYKPMITDTDIIKKGTLVFSEMYQTLKLKSPNETWFIYMGNGSVQNIYNNVFVLLLNKTPNKKECYYTINKNNMIISAQMLRNDKLNTLKILTKSFDEIINTKKILKYN